MDLERIDHVAIAVKNLEESIRFYTKILGMKLDRIVSLPEFNLRVAFVTKGGADIELMEFENGSIPVGVRHICVRVSDVPAAAEELMQSGVEIVRPLERTSLGFWHMMIREPSGVIIAILDASHKGLMPTWQPY